MERLRAFRLALLGCALLPWPLIWWVPFTRRLDADWYRCTPLARSPAEWTALAALGLGAVKKLPISDFATATEGY